MIGVFIRHSSPHPRPLPARRCGDQLRLLGDRPPQQVTCLLSLNAGTITITMGFGQFDSICEKTPLPLCLLVGPASSISGATGIVSNCYARNIEVANTMIFEGAASFMHIIALGMTVIMILHIRSKFTAVGSLHSPL